MKNKVQFQKGYSFLQFMSDYGSEEKCQKALFAWRWPQGYICPECASQSYCTLKSRAIFQCIRRYDSSFVVHCFANSANAWQAFKYG